MIKRSWNTHTTNTVTYSYSLVAVIVNPVLLHGICTTLSCQHHPVTNVFQWQEQCLWDRKCSTYGTYAHNILWTGEACFTCEGVFNIHNNHLWAQDNPHAVCECQYQVCFSVSIWAGFVRDTVMGPYLLPERLTAQWYHDFLGIVLLQLLQGIHLAMGQRLWFLHDSAPVHYGEDDWQWLNMTISRKVDWM
jgi:hypothetical protein